ncbi:class I SAM-dependent methyltransferase [Pelomonas sp. V22]|uniref:class I SAM-dependent methyltransferase n=1 Tax=Pelomonas sp. V22 TaxID=2822139 RepID=UPI0024A97710|nr:class I SAM-dependent methyltransferase [Pelomonas sp. V22]MDI4632521.1 class I SAM-dependent methyltransferase [Pelomonas sp. V22]
MINSSIAPQSEAFDGYYQTARLELLDLLGEHGPLRALEIGCGAGANLVELKRRWPDCTMTGLELRPDAAQIAQASGAIDLVLQSNVLDERLSLDEGGFDLVILSHVLEHFAQPELVLERAQRWLAPGGRLLIALPNVRHISVLLPLALKGEFRYQASGILDQTHLRFFTRRSAERFLTAQGLRLLRTAPEFGGSKSRWLQRLSLGAASDLAAYAYNFLAVRA